MMMCGTLQQKALVKPTQCLLLLLLLLEVSCRREETMMNGALDRIIIIITYRTRHAGLGSARLNVAELSWESGLGWAWLGATGLAGAGWSWVS